MAALPHRDPGPPDGLRGLHDYWRAANFLAAAQIYLRDNVLLTQPLRPEHIKPRLLGHWGTVPGINLVYAHLNRLIRDRDADVLLVTGPGHGAPANLANLYLEGSLREHYPDLTPDRAGVVRLVKAFSWPGGFPSHLTPATPGTIHEGGELGYALATAFGAAFDNPDLIVACIVGDGEAETGPTATAWHSTKFLDPVGDGAVLPVLHLNGYKISSRTIFGAMDEAELRALFTGYGYEVLYVEVGGDTDADYAAAHRATADAIDRAYAGIRRIQDAARRGEPVSKPQWPMIVLRSPKGWTCVPEVDGEPVEGSYRAHQVPIPEVRTNPEHLRLLEAWLRSYRPEELFDRDGRPDPRVTATCPAGDRRMGMNPHANGGNVRRELDRPDWPRYAVEVRGRGSVKAADTRELGKYLRDVVKRNDRIFRIVCPDEMASNRLSAVFEATARQFVWPTGPRDEAIGPRGRVLEVLSEHTCQAWLQGYLLTGRHGLYPCYEAFVAIVDSMMGQYAKFLKQAAEAPWRAPVTSLTYLLSSEGWRQDHNGYSHQMPGFINTLLNKKARNVRIYLPPDANCLLSTVDHCLTSLDKINLVIASKQPMPQWLTADEAAEHCKYGASVWRWASTFDGDRPDVVLACCGVYPTAEVLAAAWLLRRELPELRVRVVNVTDLLILELDSYHPHGLSPEQYDVLFTADRPVVFNFHGYPSAVKQLLFERPRKRRFTINGYIEEGTTTTPFTLLAVNGVDRYTVAAQAVRAAGRADEVAGRLERKRAELLAYAEKHGEDADEITGWAWS
ncbi:MAG TPA: phosphoketolase family protein [Fimbriiglobus sp.]|nr:phosphoketolase family protein [Fimbriiglobus sp.]